jgi:hypothetical protein
MSRKNTSFLNFSFVLVKAITEITETLRKSIDENLYTCGVFIDFAKALDTVNHNILLNKLEAYAIRGLPLHWFASYLCNRKQYVALGDFESTRQTISLWDSTRENTGTIVVFNLYK